jgi:acylphosphatase
MWLNVHCVGLSEISRDGCSRHSLVHPAESSLMPQERRRVFYSGRVQGVGFRATCRWLARGFELVGYVRNLPDGRVELLVEGEPMEIARYLEAIQGELGGFIRDIRTEREQPGYPPLKGFTVRF